MDYYSNIIEYYDELYPQHESQISFILDQAKGMPCPVKVLRVGCATATLEHALARHGLDVTGIDVTREMIEIAQRRKKEPASNIRFLQLSSIEMGRFLKADFYDFICCLDDKITFIRDKILMRKFFYDCKQLLRTNGSLVINTLNYDYFFGKSVIDLPPKKSIRATLFRQLRQDENGTVTAYFDLETGNGKKEHVLNGAEIFPLSQNEIVLFAKEAGFTDLRFFSDFSCSPLTPDSCDLVCIIQ